MNNAMNSVATRAYYIRARGLFLIIFGLLSGCALPTPPARPAVFDFGPGAISTPAPAQARHAPLAVAEFEASAALDSNAMLYRLAYNNVQQLQPYALARWTMPPAQLLRQRLREQLGQRRALLNPGDGGPGAAAAPLTLRVELEEFSQLFETPDQSVGLLRLRATLVQPGPGGEKWVAQRSVSVQRPAPSADAPGGVRALTAASEAAVQEIEAWLQRLAP